MFGWFRKKSVHPTVRHILGYRPSRQITDDELTFWIAMLVIDGIALAVQPYQSWGELILALVAVFVAFRIICIWRRPHAR